MFQLKNQARLICESENKEELEEIKILLNKHYKQYREYTRTNYYLFPTKFDEQYTLKLEYIKYLEHKIFVIEYEIKNDVDKKNNCRKLYDVKQYLKSANIDRTNLEETIKIEQKNLHKNTVENIPKNIFELFSNEWSFLDYCSLTIKERV